MGAINDVPHYFTKQNSIDSQPLKPTYMLVSTKSLVILEMLKPINQPIQTNSTILRYILSFRRKKLTSVLVALRIFCSPLFMYSKSIKSHILYWFCAVKVHGCD